MDSNNNGKIAHTANRYTRCEIAVPLEVKTRKYSTLENYLASKRSRFFSIYKKFIQEKVFVCIAFAYKGGKCVSQIQNAKLIIRRIKEEGCLTPQSYHRLLKEIENIYFRINSCGEKSFELEQKATVPEHTPWLSNHSINSLRNQEINFQHSSSALSKINRKLLREEFNYKLEQKSCKMDASEILRTSESPVPEEVEVSTQGRTDLYNHYGFNTIQQVNNQGALYEKRESGVVSQKNLAGVKNDAAHHKTGTLIVKNIKLNLVPSYIEGLCSLFSNYGNIDEAFYHEDSQTAILNYQSFFGAQLAAKMLTGVYWPELGMNCLEIRVEKGSSKLPYESSKWISHHPNPDRHRFKNQVPVQPNMPNSTIHLSILGLGKDHLLTKNLSEYLRQICQYKRIKRENNQVHMWFIEMSTLAGAANLMMQLHDSTFYRNGYIRVSFTRSLKKPNKLKDSQLHEYNY